VMTLLILKESWRLCESWFIGMELGEGAGY
jgi:hypothetical protein